MGALGTWHMDTIADSARSQHSSAAIQTGNAGMLGMLSERCCEQILIAAAATSHSAAPKYSNLLSRIDMMEWPCFPELESLNRFALVNRRLHSIVAPRDDAPPPELARLVKFTSNSSLIQSAWNRVAGTPNGWIDHIASWWIDVAGSSMRDSDLQELGTRWPSLTRLSLSGCAKITLTGLGAIGANCPGITALDLTKCANVDDSALAIIGAGCPALTTLSLKSCRQISDAGLFCLCGRGLPLKHLDLYWCEQITDIGLGHIADGCPQLRTLLLSWCQKVTDAGIQQIALECPRLRVLSMAVCELITDESLIAVGASCAELRRLDVARCGNLTDDGMKHIVAGCVELECVIVWSCDGITEAATAMFSEVSPQTKVVTSVWDTNESY